MPADWYTSNPAYVYVLAPVVLFNTCIGVATKVEPFINWVPLTVKLPPIVISDVTYRLVNLTSDIFISKLPLPIRI